MSEVIRDFIKVHPELGEAEAFERFVEGERIKAWVGANPERREKLHREFARIWAAQHSQLSSNPAVVQVRTQSTRTEAPTSPHPEMGTRRLHVMCPSCKSLDVWTRGRFIECRVCGRHYDNMLDLIPVKPVGPFAFMFGEGAGGIATAVGLGIALLIIYGVFRWA